MKAILETIHGDWNIEQPYVTWLEHPNHSTEMRGAKLPNKRGVIPISQVPGNASVTITIEFAIDGDPKGKENDMTHKIMLLLKEIEV